MGVGRIFCLARAAPPNPIYWYGLQTFARNRAAGFITTRKVHLSVKENSPEDYIQRKQSPAGDYRGDKRRKRKIYLQLLAFREVPRFRLGTEITVAPKVFLRLIYSNRTIWCAIGI
jgi:hypothetical protein